MYINLENNFLLIQKTTGKIIMNIKKYFAGKGNNFFHQIPSNSLWCRHFNWWKRGIWLFCLISIGPQAGFFRIILLLGKFMGNFFLTWNFLAPPPLNPPVEYAYGCLSWGPKRSNFLFKHISERHWPVHLTSWSGLLDEEESLIWWKI